MEEDNIVPRLLGLPAELIQNVLQFLEPTCLVDVALTCRYLRNHAFSDSLWQQHVNGQIPHTLTSAAPLPSFRDLYITHHPYWFLCRHKIWFSDSEPNGKLLITRYDSRRGCIEAYAIVAEPGIRKFEHWEHDEDVSIHTFNPKVQLDLNSPVLKLDPGNPRTQVRLPEDDNDNQSNQSLPLLSREIMMDCSAPPGLYTSFMLARDLPEVAIGPGTRVWPPLKIPALSRTRNASTRAFQALSHRPSTLNEVSQNTFRLRKWVEFSGRRHSSSIMALGAAERIHNALGFGGFAPTLMHAGGHGMTVRMGEEVSTYATLPQSCYVPSKQKPWQGIWCGDYSGHGCEFLLVLQPDKDEEIALPDGMDHMLEWLATGHYRRQSNSSQSSDSSYASAQEDQNPGPSVASPYEPSTPATSSVEGLDIYSGRIEAIKLTGDPNVPRGEYTFIAPDISDGGLVRIADEAAFRGARVVRSAGHIAGVGFAHDEYMPSQLILISPDCLAQHWIEFGHISYYRRVDIDSLCQI
ncbi:hypothetical protein E4T39_05231 [Aureobasidium subglaciale]|nr:hypothetical protein E4T39_05231 [Aureobasidium subglaciale]